MRSGVIYHSRGRGELTIVQALGSAVVIDSPCLFEDTNSYNYVRPPLSYILPISLSKIAGGFTVQHRLNTRQEAVGELAVSLFLAQSKRVFLLHVEPLNTGPSWVTVLRSAAAFMHGK